MALKTPSEEVLRKFYTTQDPYKVSDSLAATAAELGLEKNFRQLEEEGYTVIEDAAPQEFVQRLRGTILEHQSRVRTKGSGPRLLIGKDPVFSEAIINPKALAVVEFMCGSIIGLDSFAPIGGALAYQLAASVRRKGSPALFLHADHGASIPAPFPEHNYIVTICWACDDFSREAGATLVVPGSHTLRRQPTAEEAEAKEGAIAVECPAGSLVVWGGSVWHGNWPRTIEGERVVLHASYCRGALRTIDIYDHLGDDFIEEWGPAMKTLLRRGPGLLESTTVDNDELDLSHLYRSRRTRKPE